MTNENNRQSVAEFVGDALRNYFDNAGISQQEIAERLNITQASVSARFCGLRGFGKNAAKKWADEFGFNKGFLVNGTGCLLEENDSQTIHQNITGNSGVAINQAGGSGQIQVGCMPGKTKAGEGFFAKLCQDLMQQIIERDERICCLEDEINNLKNK